MNENKAFVEYEWMARWIRINGSLNIRIVRWIRTNCSLNMNKQTVEFCNKWATIGSYRKSIFTRNFGPPAVFNTPTVCEITVDNLKKVNCHRFLMTITRFSFYKQRKFSCEARWCLILNCFQPCLLLNCCLFTYNNFSELSDW